MKVDEFLKADQVYSLEMSFVIVRTRYEQVGSLEVETIDRFQRKGRISLTQAIRQKLPGGAKVLDIKIDYYKLNAFITFTM